MISTPPLKWAQEAIQPQIQAQKEITAKAGKKKRQITVTVVPEEILQEAKTLAGDRIVNALLTSAKLEREAAVNAIFEEVGQKLVEKFGGRKGDPVRSQGRTVLHAEGSCSRIDLE